MVGDVGHMGGLTNPRPCRGRVRASYFNTCEPLIPRKRAYCEKNSLHLTLLGYHKQKNKKLALIRYRNWQLIEANGNLMAINYMQYFEGH